MLSSNTSGVSEDANYIESVFSTYLYSGNDGTQNIVNGIDLATKGGMVWNKDRTNAYNHYLFETDIGRQALSSNLTQGLFSTPSAGTDLASYNTNGFTVGPPNTTNINGSGRNYVTWTFRKQPKFFDVVTYTGNGTAGRTIAHSLGSAPGFMVVKCTSTTGDWAVYHRSLGASQTLQLNTTAVAAGPDYWNGTAPTSTVFSVGTDAAVNSNGATYVAYLFAHNAGGFGLTGTDNVISCDYFTDSSGSINLGYEPQLILYKGGNVAGDWTVIDTMRGLPATGDTTKQLYPNLSNAETSGYSPYITSTGFKVQGVAAGAYIYIAIRRGPMKVPTDGTKVFSPNLSAASTGTNVTTNFPIDLQIQSYPAGPDNNFVDRLRGVSSTSTAAGPYLRSTTTAAEAGTNATLGWSNTAFQITAGFSGASTVYYNFRRAPSFFDEVCYTGTGSNPNVQTHNLGVAPELMIVKRRNSSANWLVATKFTASDFLFLYLDLDIGNTTSSYPSGIVNAQPTATSFSIANTGNLLNASGGTYVAYLFASAPGVSKVGSYTGTGTTKQVDCGFAAGARFVLIKKTSGTGSWYVWDSARGIVSGNDPYLLLNSTAAEVTSTDYIDTYAAGFEISSTAPSEINENGGSFIFLAIA